MKDKYYIQLRLVACDLNTLISLVDTYKRLGFSHYGEIQDNSEVYWADLSINMGLVNEKNT